MDRPAEIPAYYDRYWGAEQTPRYDPGPALEHALRSTVRPGDAVLDVGCGAGEFAAVAAARGWEVTGVEPMEQAAALARDRGLRVHTGLLADAALPDGSFDVVSALHVLEHQPDSRAFLRELGVMARPGGHVVLEVPNLASELRERTREKWMHLRPLEHLVQFEPDSLRRALEGAGLELVDLSTPSWVLRSHTLAEGLENVGRGDWERWLAAVSPTREVLPGTHAKVPGVVARAALRSTTTRYERRLRGMVLLAIARVPAR